MKRSAASGIVFGIFVILFGLFFLGRSYGWFIDFNFTAAEFWALVIIAVAVVSIVNSGFHFWNVLFLIVGGWIFAGQLGFLGRHSFLTLIAVLLILLGIWIIVRAVSRPRFDGRVESGGAYVNEDSNEYIKYECTFGDTTIKNTSKFFKGGVVSVTFGHMVLDLSNIEVHGEAMIEVSSVFGELEIKLPRNVPYKAQVTPVLGSFVNYAPTVPVTPGQPYLQIKGSAVFGSCRLV